LKWAADPGFASADERDLEADTPFAEIVAKGHYRIIKSLLKYGADPTQMIGVDHPLTIESISISPRPSRDAYRPTV
jgi:ankyrin repeat protein